MIHTSNSLIAFEDRVKEAFLKKQITSPVHLSGGNEESLIRIFQNIQPNDWVFSNWRSHYHALLKGIHPDWIFNEIVAGRSMYLINKEHKFIASSIVGGILPIACGVALAAKRLEKEERIWVFVGDMTSRTGIYHEFLSYCDGFELPVNVVIEDNGLSTNTPTKETWGNEEMETVSSNIPTIRCSYKRVYPHVGVGEFVSFS